jgi:hypothetical protein
MCTYKSHIDAIAEFNQALPIEPNNNDCLCNIGISEKIGNISEARKHKERTSNCDNDFVDKTDVKSTTADAI